METRYYLLTGRRTDADWVRIRGQLWNAAQAKQSPKGRVALVEAVGNIFVTLRQPKVPGFDPYHVVDQMLSATVPEDQLEAEKRRATATLKRLGIQKGAARGAAAGKVWTMTLLSLQCMCQPRGLFVATAICHCHLVHCTTEIGRLRHGDVGVFVQALVRPRPRAPSVRLPQLHSGGHHASLQQPRGVLPQQAQALGVLSPVCPAEHG